MPKMKHLRDTKHMLEHNIKKLEQEADKLTEQLSNLYLELAEFPTQEEAEKFSEEYESLEAKIRNIRNQIELLSKEKKKLSKISVLIKKAEEETVIDPNELIISFNDDLYDYYVALEPNSNSYITYIDEIKIGFGPKYSLLKALKKVKELFPNGITLSMIETEPIPSISKPVVRRLGGKSLKEIEKKIKNERRKWQGNTQPTWEISEGTENSYSKINRPEENWTA